MIYEQTDINGVCFFRLEVRVTFRVDTLEGTGCPNELQ